jgi:Leucine-rich repeat (LRR) protein
LWLDQNKIQIIVGDLFDFNPNLEIIFLASNKIIFIDSEAFGGLKKLRFLHLEFNPCTSDGSHSFNDHEKAQQVIEDVKKSCEDPNRKKKSFDKK